MYLFFFSQLNNYYAIKEQVEERWDMVILLFMLLFFLVCMAVLFAILRPEGVVRQTVALALILPLSYLAAIGVVQAVVVEDVKSRACVELMNKIGFASVSESRCAESNPIKLEFIVPPWNR